jgi:hypothetical protein
MSGEHILCLGVGILLGWLVVPLVLSMFVKKTG